MSNSRRDPLTNKDLILGNLKYMTRQRDWVRLNDLRNNTILSPTEFTKAYLELLKEMKLISESKKGMWYVQLNQDVFP